MKISALLLSLLLFPQILLAQFGIEDSELPIDEGELTIGGDIFTDFNEDLDAANIAEDERFYRYGRFFSFNIGLGFTTFDGNRGAAYDDSHPGYSIFFNSFLDFQNSFTVGISYSKHIFDVPFPTEGNTTTIPGAIQINMLRAFFGYRYYFDTSNLGTALTYANPYMTMRLEYWYQTNKFDPDTRLPNQQGGALGFGAGLGLEFPIKLKETYLNVEFLIHSVNFFDKDTDEWNAIEAGQGFGYDDLRGNVYSLFINYVIHW